jgi:tRNA A-37 threonylcarbamoyl transferase component Bud32
VDHYRRFIQGQTASAEEVERLAEHLEQCPHCSETAEQLLGKDPLLDVLRSGAMATDFPQGTLVEELIARLVRPRLPAPAAEETAQKLPRNSTFLAPPLARPASPAAEATTALYDFLSPPQGPDEIGRLGPYCVRKMIGSGGMGIVFLAEDVWLKRPVALKAMKPVLASNVSASQRFLREAQATAAVKHDHIVTIYQVGDDRGIPFLAMELLEGESLEERLRRGERLPMAEVLRIGREIALGLAAAHKRDLIHRDIKPANIWLEAETGRVKLVDFGLARAVHEDAHLTQSGVVVGTPAYMAPEQATGRTVDARCDLFSLGCTLYRLGTGELPFKGKDALSVLMAAATQQPLLPRDRNPELPPAFSDLVMQLLAKDPDGRPPSAQNVAEALQALEGEARTETRRESPSSATQLLPAVLPRRRRPVRIAALIAAAVLLLGGVWPVVLLRDRHGKEVARIQAPDGAVEVRDDAPSPAADQCPFPPLDEAWVKKVRLLPAMQQVKEVAAELKRRNPGFDGTVTHRERLGEVIYLRFAGNEVTDLLPVRALPELRKLDCSCTTEGKQKLADLSPLRGLPLEELICIAPRIADLSPLRGMPLKHLCIGSCPVTDLSPLRGMRLEILTAYGILAQDFSVLEGMPLRRIIVGRNFSDLSCLRDAPLEAVFINGTQVTDLSPLRGKAITILDCRWSRVTDLSPLRGMPLKELVCDFSSRRDAELLRSLKTLEKINGKPAAEFWKQAEADKP